MVNLATHILVFALGGDVTGKECGPLASNTWSISCIVIWELTKLIQLERIDMDQDGPEVVRALARIYVWTHDLAVSIQSTNLDFRGDAADELIAPTSVNHKVPLVTRNRRIRSSRLVPLA